MFKVGDRVKAFGCEGVVIQILNDMLTVELGGIEIGPSSHREYFHLDGLYERWHKEPSLVLVSRANTKVKLYPALCKYDTGYYIPEDLFSNEAQARKHYPNFFIRLLTDDHHAVEIEEC